MKTNGDYLELTKKEEDLFLESGMHPVGSKIHKNDFKAMIAPVPGKPAFILPNAMRIRNTRPDVSPAYRASFEEKILDGQIIAMAANKITTGASYAELFNVADWCGLAIDQLDLSEKSVRQSVRDYNPKTEKVMVSKDAVNAFRNYHQISAEFVTGDSHSVESGKDKGPAFVVASGVSLDKALPLLASWEGPVFCTSSHFGSLVYHGVKNIFVLALDVNTGVKELQEAGPDASKDHTLLLHPGIDPAVVKFWKGKKLYYRCMDYENQIYKHMARAYDFIKMQVYLFSSSVPTQVSLANVMGYGPIFLAGCDFAADRFSRWACSDYKIPNKNGVTKEREWKKITPSPADHARCPKSNNNIPTDNLQIYYKRSFLMSVLLDHAPVINCSGRSIITELPTAKIEKVIERQGKRFGKILYPDWKLHRSIEQYLMDYDTYMVRFRNPNGGQIYYKYAEGPGMLAIADYMRRAGSSPGDIDDMCTHILWLKNKAKESPYL